MVRADDAARARLYLDELAAGIDPRRARTQATAGREQERAVVFRAVADAYQTRHLQYLDRGLDQWRYIDYELLWPENKRDSWREKPVYQDHCR